MSSSESIKNRGITRKMLPDNMNRTGNRPPGQSPQQVMPNTNVRQAGEIFKRGCALYVYTDGKLYKASNTAADNKPAICIALEDAELNQFVKYGINDRVSDIDGVNFAPQSPLWLIDDGQTVNVSTTPPTLNTGDILQPIGWADTTNSYWINIQEPEYLF